MDTVSSGKYEGEGIEEVYLCTCGRLEIIYKQSTETFRYRTDGVKRAMISSQIQEAVLDQGVVGANPPEVSNGSPWLQAAHFRLSLILYVKE